MKIRTTTLASIITLSATILGCGLAQAGPGTSGSDTATGADALANDTSGGANTADGFFALNVNTTGSDNTGVGDYSIGGNALDFTTGSDNSALGHDALTSLTSGSQNTAAGSQALVADTTGSENTAVGSEALEFVTTGSHNTVVGNLAAELVTGSGNTALGDGAMSGNASAPSVNGSNNTATGYQALTNLSTGSNNVAEGASALLKNTTGANNVAIGGNALENVTSGANNIAIGFNAGTTVTTGSNNITIGGVGFTGDTGAIRIGNEGVQTKLVMAGIWGATASGGLPVYVNGNGQLGTVKSSARFKTNIHPMGNVSDLLLALHPVTFQYKPDVDPSGQAQFGLIAEQVEKVDPDLVVHDNDHQIYSVRYDAVNAMLLNEFQKQHETIVEQAKHAEVQDKTIDEQQKMLLALTARLNQMEQELAKK